MVEAKNLIRRRLKCAIASYRKYRDKDAETQFRMAHLWHEDCYGYITAMFDLNLIGWHDYVFYMNVNDKIRNLSC